jgi:NAD(P)-dependent dehydrogenase (short-subunit alcohol dehydrogenase family)
MTDPVDNQPVALVTGGGSGIGKATVLLLAMSGYRVIVVDRDSSQAHNVAQSVQQAGGIAVVAVLDISTVTGAEASAASSGWMSQ